VHAVLRGDRFDVRWRKRRLLRGTVEMAEHLGACTTGLAITNSFTTHFESLRKPCSVPRLKCRPNRLLAPRVRVFVDHIARDLRVRGLPR
jgi:hypothetical protein